VVFVLRAAAPARRPVVVRGAGADRMALRDLPPPGPSAAGRAGGAAVVTEAPKPTAPEAVPELSAGDAEWLEAMAAQKRAFAAEGGGDPLWAAQLQAEAAGMEALATTLRDPAARGVSALHPGRGGETAPRPHGDMSGRCRDVATAVAQSPALLTAEATLDRLSLARDANVLTLAVEAAEDATAAEKMLAHQLAAAHKLAMELIATASRDACRHRAAPHLNQGALVEVSRSAQAAARLMVACQGAALALDRLRHGARQQIVVQHVAVADGGQAVVAGSVAPRGATRREGEDAR
jgi:hypothetical protein